jgi:hypothetical protein
MGKPRPLAKEGGLARPARPKMVISAKPTRMARHSAGGGRLAKREVEGGVMDAIVAAWMWI